jgi:hypothetical protein
MVPFTSGLLFAAGCAMSAQRGASRFFADSRSIADSRPLFDGLLRRDSRSTQTLRPLRPVLRDLCLALRPLLRPLLRADLMRPPLRPMLRDCLYAPVGGGAAFGVQAFSL